MALLGWRTVEKARELGDRRALGDELVLRRVWIGMADILAQYQIFVGEALAMLRELVGLR